MSLKAHAPLSDNTTFNILRLPRSSDQSLSAATEILQMCMVSWSVTITTWDSSFQTDAEMDEEVWEGVVFGVTKEKDWGEGTKKKIESMPKWVAGSEY